MSGIHPKIRQGSIRLFRFSGVDLFLHWSWFVVAVIEVEFTRGRYSSIAWNAAEYLALFVIVLLHEFGHALACRQVGGTANEIILWPLGGAAYVEPPERPGATLWSIAAGPLVNVALVPVLFALMAMSDRLGWAQTMPDASTFVHTVFAINLALLAFNLLPFFPLDGGQILRALLWYWLGRGRSLMAATVLGLMGMAACVGVCLWLRHMWLYWICGFLLLNSWRGLRHAQLLLLSERSPRRAELACPSCGKAPQTGAYWKCGKCKKPFDTFASGAVCPHCGTGYPMTACLACKRQNPMEAWKTGGAAVKTQPPAA